MIGRHTLNLLLVGGAMAVPYFSSHQRATDVDISDYQPPKRVSANYASSATEKSSDTTESTTDPAGARQPADRLAQKPSTTKPVSTANPSSNSDASAASGTAASESTPGATAPNLEEYFNFEINSGWVANKWPRVTAGLPVRELQGYRAPLFTGTGEKDLAGAITYYFDTRQQLERIIFHGTTGDPRALITLMTGKYSFERDYTNDPGTFIYRVKRLGQPYSELRIKPAKVMRSAAPNERYEIDLALRRP